MAPLTKWEEEWKAAASSGVTINHANIVSGVIVNRENIVRLLCEFAAAKEEGTDGDTVLSQRHCSRMSDLVGSCVAECCQDGNTELAKALIDGGLGKLVEPRNVWASMWSWRSSASLAFMDTLLQDDALAASLSNKDLHQAIIYKPFEFAEKLLEPRFTDNDQIYVTEEILEQAKYDERGRPVKSKVGKKLLAFLEQMKEARDLRMQEAGGGGKGSGAGTAAGSGGKGEQGATASAPAEKTNREEGREEDREEGAKRRKEGEA